MQGCILSNKSPVNLPQSKGKCRDSLLSLSYNHLSVLTPSLGDKIFFPVSSVSLDSRCYPYVIHEQCSSEHKGDCGVPVSCLFSSIRIPHYTFFLKESPILFQYQATTALWKAGPGPRE